jgi:hypothetical protein
MPTLDDINPDAILVVLNPPKTNSVLIHRLNDALYFFEIHDRHSPDKPIPHFFLGELTGRNITWYEIDPKKIWVADLIDARDELLEEIMKVEDPAYYLRTGKHPTELASYQPGIEREILKKGATPITSSLAAADAETVVGKIFQKVITRTQPIPIPGAKASGQAKAPPAALAPPFSVDAGELARAPSPSRAGFFGSPSPDRGLLAVMAAQAAGAGAGAAPSGTRPGGTI